MVARAVDQFLIPHRSFGVRHVLEVVLRYTDIAIGLLESAWQNGDIGREGPVVVAAGEVDAARRLIEMGTPSQLASTTEHRLALEWLTCDAGDLPYEPSHPQSPFERFARVRSADGRSRWLPPAFLPEILGFAVSELASEAADMPGANGRFAQEVAAETRRMLWRFGPLYGPNDEAGAPVVSASNVVQWVSAPTPRHVVLVHVVSGLRLNELPFKDEPEALRVARKLSAGESSPVAVMMPNGQLRVDPDTVAVPFLVVGSPGHVAAPQAPRLPGMSLDDLRWAARTAESTSDLFTYCRDMSRPDLPPFFGWEAINIWEWWRANRKSVFSGGRAPTFISFTPHAGEAEWRRAAELTSLEVALARLDLPSLRDVVGIDQGDKSPPVIYRFATAVGPGEVSSTSEEREAWHERPDLEAWTVYVARVPVAVSALRPDWEDDFVEVLHDMSGAFGFALRAVADTWESAHIGTGIVGHLIDLSPQRLGSEVGFLRWALTTSVDHPDGALVHSTLEVNQDAFDAEHTDITSVLRDEMAEAAMEILRAAGVGGDAARLVGDAWRAAPPMLAVQVLRPPTVRNDLVSPVKLDEALISQVDRRVAEAVRAAGVEPGDYTGRRAKELDRDVLAPAALAQLNDTLAAHSMDDLVRYGMEQLERCLNRKDRALRDVRQSAAKLQIEWDPAEKYQELEAKYLLLRRCCETAVEASLRSAAHGAKPVDSIAWGEVLAAAHAYLAATMRSEGIHHQVSPTLLRVSESWELSIKRDDSGEAAPAAAGGGRVYDFDAQAMGKLRATELLSADQEVDEEDLLELENPVEDVSAVDVVPTDGAAETVAVAGGADAANASSTPDGGGREGPVDADVDAAMLDAYGASGTNVLSVLFALAQWPLSEDDRDAVAVDREAVIDHVLEYTALGEEPEGRAKVEAAVRLLTSSSADLSAEDWKPWHARSRKRRILIQPLPTMSDGRLVVGPHLCLGALAVYQRYLDQGQLPWSQPQPPVQVDQALERFRDRRNKALERQVGTLLRQHGWSVIDNVKENKADRLSVPKLQTEIDAVAGRAGDPNIWLLEVKDPVDVFVIPEIRRALDSFFVDGKKPAYATQLQRKCEDLKPHAAAVAEALGLPSAPPEAPYVIKPMFVTRRAVPAAFVSGPFPFVSLPQLVETVGHA
ncbi:hypothetical protein [Nocardioides sp. GXZ039]|uniref:hypothetical protein n=1 Tax=Nocardioides sp. GXZ039 TaxID=3136018 RepID=UPI0030F41AD2